jgi:hypothetical protein
MCAVQNVAFVKTCICMFEMCQYLSIFNESLNGCTGTVENSKLTIVFIVLCRAARTVGKFNLS